MNPGLADAANVLVAALCLFLLCLFIGIAVTAPATGELHRKMHDGRTVTCVYTKTTLGSLSCDWANATEGDQ